MRRLSRLSPAYANLKEQSSGPGCMLLYHVRTNYRLLRSIRDNRRYLVVGYETVSPERVIGRVRMLRVGDQARLNPSFKLRLLRSLCFLFC